MNEDDYPFIPNISHVETHGNMTTMQRRAKSVRNFISVGHGGGLTKSTLHSTETGKTVLFLVACCQLESTTEDVARIRDFGSDKLDEAIDIKSLESTPFDQPAETQIIKMAHRHGVYPLVYLAILRHASDLVSPDKLELLKQKYFIIVQQNLRLVAALHNILRLLAENQVEVFSLKGPVLAQLAYGDITLRQYVDLDLLIDTAQVKRVGQLLMAQGFEPSVSPQLVGDGTYLDVSKDISFVNWSSQVCAELHWRLLEKRFGWSLQACATGAKRLKISVHNRDVETLQIDLLLIYLCCHGAKHTFERIEWICDLDRLIRSQNIDWVEVNRISFQSKARRPFLLGLALCSFYFRTPLPAEIRHEIKSDFIIRLRDKTVYLMRHPFLYETEFEKNRARFFYQIQLLDTWIMRGRFIFLTLFGISPIDCQTFLLPSHLKILYIFVRPFRLLAHYGRKLCSQ